MCMKVHYLYALLMEARRGHWILLELELQMAESSPDVLGAELTSSRPQVQQVLLASVLFYPQTSFLF